MYYSTAKEMEKLDTLAVENGLSIIQMMELAGFHMTTVFQKLRIPKTKKIVVLIGVGNKGGDGLSAARHLINNGWSHISIILSRKKTTRPSAHHRKLLEEMKIEMVYYNSKSLDHIKELITEADVIIDSLIGYHLKGAPHGPIADLIMIANASKKFIISYDMPSGIDATTGKCHNPSITAKATLTLALPKKLFLEKCADDQSGKIFLGDIGIPAFLYEKIKTGSRPAFDVSGILTF
jgi:hydroxyethylthiazole kinase-like uncharacterized protein yjeF